MWNFEVMMDTTSGQSHLKWPLEDAHFACESRKSNNKNNGQHSN
jgi:hypothetical protein